MIDVGNQRTGTVHELAVTIWVGKRGIEPVVDELADQLEDRQHVKVRFLRSALGQADADELAADLADRVGAEVVDVRGHTAVIQA